MTRLGAFRPWRSRSRAAPAPSAAPAIVAARRRCAPRDSDRSGKTSSTARPRSTRSCARRRSSATPSTARSSRTCSAWRRHARAMRGVTSLEALEGCDEIIVGIRKDRERRRRRDRLPRRAREPRPDEDDRRHGPHGAPSRRRAREGPRVRVGRSSEHGVGLALRAARSHVGRRDRRGPRSRAPGLRIAVRAPCAEDRSRGARVRAPRRRGVPQGPRFAKSPMLGPLTRKLRARHARAATRKRRRRRDAAIRRRGRERVGRDARRARASRRSRAPAPKPSGPPPRSTGSRPPRSATRETPSR